MSEFDKVYQQLDNLGVMKRYKKLSKNDIVNIYITYRDAKSTIYGLAEEYNVHFSSISRLLTKIIKAIGTNDCKNIIVQRMLSDK